MNYEVVWNGSHCGDGRDSLLPPRDERTNPCWTPGGWTVVGFVEQLLWQDRHPGVKANQRGSTMGERIRLQVMEKRRGRR